MPGVRGGGHLSAPAPEEPVQGVWGGGHLPAPAPEEPLQGVRDRAVRIARKQLNHCIGREIKEPSPDELAQINAKIQAVLPERARVRHASREAAQISNSRESCPVQQSIERSCPVQQSIGR